jgi:Flp pilus assembly protein TadD
MNKNALHYLSSLFLAIALGAYCNPNLFGQGANANANAVTTVGKIRSHTRKRTRKRNAVVRSGAGPRLVSLLIITDPPNCHVSVNDEPRGETDADGELEILLPPDSYQIHVSRAGYIGERDQIEITSTPVEQEAEFNLKLLMKTLKVITDPPQARVYLDDAYKGDSDTGGALAIEEVNSTRSHKLRASKAAFIDNSILVPPNSSEVSIKLPPDLITLKVTTDPPKAEVYLDDAYKGTSNADGLLSIEQVSPAQHTLRASKAGYIDNATPVSSANSQVSIKLSLDPAIVSVKAIKQHLAAGQLDDAFTVYNSLAQDKPDYEDLQRLLDSILQGLQSRSMNMLMQMGPYGLSSSVEGAQAMSQLYEQALKLRPDDTSLTGFAEYWKIKYLLAKAQRTSLSAEKEALFRSALAIAPRVEALNSENAYLLFDLAWTYRALSHSVAAKKDYESAQRLDPNWAYPHFALGLIDMSVAEQEKARALKSSYYQAAIDKFAKAINLKPDFSRAYAMRCISYAVLNMHQEAIANGQQAVAMRPQNSYAHFALGFAYYQKGKTEYRNSMNEFDRALSLKEDEIDEVTKNNIQQKLAQMRKSLGLKH